MNKFVVMFERKSWIIFIVSILQEIAVEVAHHSQCAEIGSVEGVEIGHRRPGNTGHKRPGNTGHLPEVNIQGHRLIKTGLRFVTHSLDSALL